MEENRKKPKLYSLPLIVHSSYKPIFHVLFLLIIIIFIGFSFIPMNDLGEILIRLLSLAFGLFFAYCWVYMGVMKKGHIELTEDGISLRTIFSYKKLKWTDIVNIQTYYVNSNSFIGIISKEKLKKRKDNFLTLIWDLFGGKYSLTIPLRSFPTAEPEKLYSTIYYTVQEKHQHNCNEEENIKDIIENKKEEKLIDSNPVTALFKALIVTLISGIIYGLSIYLFKINFLLIPIIGMIGILYIYSKNYQEKHFNIIIRFFLGVLCALQFFVALLVALLMLNSNLIEIYGIWNMISDCIMNIVRYRDEYALYYIFAAVCLFTGTFLGYSFKTIRKVRKIFMHKQNGFYIKREKRYVTIYLIDYAKYNENEEKYILEIMPNICLIEKEKKNISAFYIPEEWVEHCNIGAKKFERISVNGKMYYKLNLGGHVKPQDYGYSCFLILNKYKQVELIKLETD